MEKIGVIIFEDNVLMRESLVGILELDEQVNVLAAYEHAADIVTLYEVWKPDVIITDIDMPGGNGLNGLRELKAAFPDAKVLMLTVFEDNDNILNAICLGANGYILKSASEQQITYAIYDVMQGGSPLTPIVASKILQHFPKQTQQPQQEDYNLSQKEKEVLQLLVKGYSYKMIAAQLDKSVETIRVQIKSIYRKLQVQSNAEAIIKALDNKLV